MLQRIVFAGPVDTKTTDAAFTKWIDAGYAGEFVKNPVPIDKGLILWEALQRSEKNQQ